MKEDIRDLLERAESTADGRGRSAVTTESVYAEVAGVRRRRRRGLAGAVAALVLAGAAVVPVLDRDRDRGGTPAIAAEGQHAGDSAGAARAKQVAGLLAGDTDGIVSVTRIRDAPIPTGYRENSGDELDWGDVSTGPLDGHYLILRQVERKTVATGLSLSTMSATTARKVNGRIKGVEGCAAVSGCSRAPGPAASTVYSWKTTNFFALGGAPWRKFGDQRLVTYPDGSVLLAADGVDLGPFLSMKEYTARGGVKDFTESRDLALSAELTPLGAKRLTALAGSAALVPRPAAP
ncbi:hypothetical protein ACIQ9E_04790 [Streptomyces sp. NPDC094448]|uniref:hypothetical protein n=1 Tax=Streptomyces sp. NPDC094448 TaxID=3366063 RepID=UPI00380C4A33